jgi:glycosyltransferase involved in cell wall biosynthesis
MSPSTGVPALPPRVLLWAVGAKEADALQSLQALVLDAACWSGIEVFADASACWEAPAHEGLRIKQHKGVCGWAAAFASMTVPMGVPVAWLTVGTRTAAGWIEPLQQALHGESALGSCSPLALGSSLHSPFFETEARAADLEALNQWLRAHAKATVLELGSPLAAAGLMRHEAWRAVCENIEQHWALSVARAGWVHGSSLRACVALTDPKYQGEHGGVSPGATPSLSLLADHKLWERAHPLTGLRHAISELREVPKHPGLKVDSSPVRLHIMHSWGGGLSRWVHDFCQADAQTGSGRGLLLKSVGTYGAFAQRLELHAGHDGGVPLETWELGLPIHATALAHLQVQEILRDVIDRYGVSHVLVSSLIGHSLDVLRTGLPTALVMHDHHPFCVTLYAQFQGECRTCDRQRLQSCVRENSGHRFFKGVHADDWQALRDCFVDTVLKHRPTLVAPSPSVADRWLSFMPALQEVRIEVIEHGIDMPVAPNFEPAETGPLRVVVLGRLSAEKGRDLLIDILPATDGWTEVLLLGCGEQVDEFKSLPHVRVIPHFEHAELGDHIARWKPHLGLLTSTVPETFSYALSELWHCRVPVLACAMGALADRIEDGRNGYLEPPSSQDLLARLRQIHEQRQQLQQVRQRISQQPTRDLAAMLRDYLRTLNWQPRTRPVPTVASSVPSLHEVTHSVPRGTARWLHVNPEATWMQALQGFLSYTTHKAAHSPRVPSALKRWLRR